MNTLLGQGRYFGSKKAELCIEGLILTESVYLPGNRIPMHSHENAHMSWILKGIQQEEDGRETRLCEPDTLAFRPARTTHAHRIGPTGLLCLHIEFGACWVEREQHRSWALTTAAHSRKYELSTVMGRIYQEFLHPDEVSPLAIEGEVLRILSKLCRSSSSSERRSVPPWLRQARDILHERYSESLSLRAISDCVGVHPVHLAREFRRHYQATVATTLRQLRIQAACKAMGEGDLALIDIGMACGFADQAHFCRLFKRMIGMTPAQFRSQARSRRRRSPL
jgi:AraC family transcriptional regulator